MARWLDVTRSIGWILAALAFGAWFVSLALGANWAATGWDLLVLAVFGVIAFWLVAGALLRAPLVRRRLGLPARRR